MSTKDDPDRKSKPGRPGTSGAGRSASARSIGEELGGLDFEPDALLDSLLSDDPAPKKTTPAPPPEPAPPPLIPPPLAPPPPLALPAAPALADVPAVATPPDPATPSEPPLLAPLCACPHAFMAPTMNVAKAILSIRIDLS